MEPVMIKQFEDFDEGDDLKRYWGIDEHGYVFKGCRAPLGSDRVFWTRSTVIPTIPQMKRIVKEFEHHLLWL